MLRIEKVIERKEKDLGISKHTVIIPHEDTLLLAYFRPEMGKNGSMNSELVLMNFESGEILCRRSFVGRVKGEQVLWVKNRLTKKKFVLFVLQVDDLRYKGKLMAVEIDSKLENSFVLNENHPIYVYFSVETIDKGLIVFLGEDYRSLVFYDFGGSGRGGTYPLKNRGKITNMVLTAMNYDSSDTHLFMTLKYWKEKNLIISAGSENSSTNSSISAFSIKKKRVVKEFKNPGGVHRSESIVRVTIVQGEKNIFYTVGQYATSILWDYEKGEVLKKITGYSGMISFRKYLIFWVQNEFKISTLKKTSQGFEIKELYKLKRTGEICWVGWIKSENMMETECFSCSCVYDVPLQLNRVFLEEEERTSDLEERIVNCLDNGDNFKIKTSIITVCSPKLFLNI